MFTESKMPKSLKISFLLLLGILGSCREAEQYWNELNEQPDAERQVLVQVGNSFLYADQLTELLPANTQLNDSSGLTERYINNWVRQELLRQRATDSVASLDQQKIEEKVENYRKQLLVYAYERDMVQQLLDTATTAEQIKAYYTTYEDNFILRENIIKGMFLKVPASSPDQAQLKRWMQKPGDEESASEVRSYAFTYATTAHLDDSTWISLDELINNTPFQSEIASKTQAIRQNKLLEAEDSLFNYYLNINEYKFSNQLSPLPFVEEQIRDLLLAKRKTELRNKHEQEIYDWAMRNGLVKRHPVSAPPAKSGAGSR
jgi:hypothetical protein